jgi:uncharacterized protein
VIFEWDPVKAERNRRKHGVTFAEASSVFRDPFAITFDDPDHSHDERRFITIGVSARQRVLCVAHVDRRVGRVRLISARRAVPNEANAYQESRR